jgi:hypothetical protein
MITLQGVGASGISRRFEKLCLRGDRLDLNKGYRTSEFSGKAWTGQGGAGDGPDENLG